ncbi:P2X purinoceptor 7-like [Siniperca chuatsi]|uniref:P2X purinoceptor 7-like n=1 Tax=Siniperca chuatsi TaxID=119488 RepID=UPI001CE0E304|nr:P2X purinoceptor 7-like [Siniperca chuatsi]
MDAPFSSIIGFTHPYKFEPPQPESNSEDNDQLPENQPHPSWSATERCTCGECRTMPTEDQNVCCKDLNAVQNRYGELPEEPWCGTLYPGLEPVCLKPYSLQNTLNTYQADHGPLEMKERAVRARYLAYRCFASWCWGYLGKHNRVVIPFCVVLHIQEYLDEDGEYTGFKPPI